MDGFSTGTQLLRQVGDLLWGRGPGRSVGGCHVPPMEDTPLGVPWWHHTRRLSQAPPQPLRPQRTLEVLILPLEGLQMLQRLLIGVLELEELCAEGACLLLRGLQLGLGLLILLLPLGQDLWGPSSLYALSPSPPLVLQGLPRPLCGAQPPPQHPFPPSPRRRSLASW